MIAYVIGSARCVWSDLEGENLDAATLFCVNEMGNFIDRPFAHWVSLHGEYLIHWMHLWEAHHIGSGGPTLHTSEPHSTRRRTHLITAGVVLHQYVNNGGTSGHFGAFLALSMGFDDVRLCGIPIDRSGRIFDPPWSRPNIPREAEVAWRNWQRVDPEAAAKVRSASGFTKSLLGSWKG